MNMFEKQADLSRKMIEINTTTMQSLAQTGQENIQKYIDMNTSFGQRLPEVTDITSFMSLQREYGEALMANMRTATETQAEILRTAAEETGSALRTAFTAEA